MDNYLTCVNQHNPCHLRSIITYNYYYGVQGLLQSIGCEQKRLAG